jgi:hypothetical protein
VCIELIVAYILILPPSKTFVSGGKEKKQWFVRLPRGVDEYTWGEGGEEGEEFGKSVKSVYTFLSRKKGSKLTSSRSITKGSLQRETNRYESLANRIVNVQRVGGTIGN